MHKYKITQLAIMLAILFFELLPYGAVCHFAISPESGGGTNRVTYAYFSMMPFGYANFGPLLTAIFTCIITVLLLLSITFIKKNINKIITIISSIAIFTSISPLIFGMRFYSLIGLLITCLLCAETFLVVYLNKYTK